MKASELKDKTLTELQAMGQDFRKELFNLRLQKASGQLEKTDRLRLIRRDIARVETAISATTNQKKTA